MSAPTRTGIGWGGVSLAVFTAAWGGNQFTPLLVMYRGNAQMSDVVVDALLFTYVLGIVPALLIGGPLSDRFGRRPLMLPSPLIAALGSGLLALGAHSAPLLALVVCVVGSHSVWPWPSAAAGSRSCPTATA